MMQSWHSLKAAFGITGLKNRQLFQVRVYPIVCSIDQDQKPPLKFNYFIFRFPVNFINIFLNGYCALNCSCNLAVMLNIIKR